MAKRKTRHDPATEQEEEHDNVHALFSPNSKFRVEYKPVVETLPDDAVVFKKRLDKNNKASKHNDTETATEKEPAAGKKASSKGRSNMNTMQHDTDDEDDDTEEDPITPGKAKHAPKKQNSSKSSKTEDPLDISDLKEGEALDRTIFVGNLAESTTKKHLKSHFEKYGKIESLRFRSMILKKDSKIPKRVAAASGTVDSERGSFHAYIVFEDGSSVPKALQENMKMLDDRHLRVDRAAVNKLRVKIVGAKKGSRAAAEFISGAHQVQYNVHKTVFVGNLPLHIEDEDLIRFFIAGLGTGSESLLEAVRIVRDPKTSIGKGIAFVLFKTKQARNNALRLHNKALLGRKLRISPAQSDPTSEAAHSTQRGPSTTKAHAWQGATATKSGRLRGLSFDQSKKMPSQHKTKTLKRTGKRPAVAARKLAQKQNKK
jgi:nucleolar protein 12